MNSEKYVGLDVHQATIVIAVTDSTGKLIMESILETEAATILQFVAGLRGTLYLLTKSMGKLQHGDVTTPTVCHSRGGKSRVWQSWIVYAMARAKCGSFFVAQNSVSASS